jgi:hypothetical protein
LFPSLPIGLATGVHFEHRLAKTRSFLASARGLTDGRVG